MNLGTPATAGQVNYQGTTFTLGQPTVPNAISNGAVYTLTQPGNYSSVYLIGAAAGIVEGRNEGNAPGAAFLLNYSTGNAVTETVDMSAWNRKAGGLLAMRPWWLRPTTPTRKVAEAILGLTGCMVTR